MDLNPEQKLAVQHEISPLLILAGAGSGKTRVLTHRIAYLILEKNVPPDRILAMTFTNKAANEMKERVAALTGIPPTILWISTFHSFCLKILRRYAAHLGYQNTFVVFDEGDQISLLKRCLKELNISEELISPSVAVNRISRAKDEFISAEEFEKNAGDPWSKRCAEVYNLYQASLKKQNAMDFGDLLVNVLRLFEGDASVLDHFQNKFLHVLVDEYQDTNHVQYRIIKMLGDKHKNVFVVGDEDQSIYRWRGADISNIMDFKNDFPEAVVVKLEQNYRSTPTILNAANSVIAKNKGRFGKKLWSDLPDKNKVKIVQKMGDIDEAKFVAREVEKWSRQGFRYDDMAVFYRTNAQSRILEESFRNFGIPYIIYGGFKFYERMEIKDVLAYLQVVLNSHNDTALARIINVPPRGIGKSSLDAVRAYASDHSCSLYTAMVNIVTTGSLSPRLGKGLKEFVDMIENVKARLGDADLFSITNEILEKSGYIAMYKNSKAIDADERVENLYEFLKATNEFSERANVSLSQFLDQVALVSDVDNMDKQKGAVPLMTIHFSKGLEFPIVFLVGMEEGLFPHSRSMDDDEQLEEERRICYVGMTRAKEHLYMTYCSRRRLYGREQYNLPSRFISEVDEQFVEKDLLFNVGSGNNVSNNFKDIWASQTCDNQCVHDDVEHFDQRPDDEKEEAGLKIGTRVIHPVFGEGVIRKIIGSGESQKVILQLKNGQLKTLAVKYAQLKRQTEV